MRRISIFDTTLRDGEQAPGCSMRMGEKLEVARELAALGVDVVEAGFAAASEGDAASVAAVAKAIRGSGVASLARASRADIEKAWAALRRAERPRIHTFIATSAIHMQHKLRMRPAEVLERAREAVAYAKTLCGEVEFSAEDASRSDLEFLEEIVRAVIRAGATVVNIPDTVGYSIPTEFASVVRAVRHAADQEGDVTISVHCHDDLGLAVANSLAAVSAGADQVECTVNGLGERAGNAALEEVVMALHTRAAAFGASTGLNTRRIASASRAVSLAAGFGPQPNKAIVGANAFAHEAGIHQHGMLANCQTYEIMTPESVGVARSELVLGKHSGRHAFEQRLRELGLPLDESKLNAQFEAFKAMADLRKKVSDEDLMRLARGNGANSGRMTWE